MSSRTTACGPTRAHHRTSEMGHVAAEVSQGQVPELSSMRACERRVPCAMQVYRQVASMPEPRTRFAGALFKNQIWVVAGYDNVIGSGALILCHVCRSPTDSRTHRLPRDVKRPLR